MTRRLAKKSTPVRKEGIGASRTKLPAATPSFVHQSLRHTLIVLVADPSQRRRQITQTTRKVEARSPSGCHSQAISAACLRQNIAGGVRASLFDQRIDSCETQQALNNFSYGSITAHDGCVIHNSSVPGNSSLLSFRPPRRTRRDTAQLPGRSSRAVRSPGTYDNDLDLFQSIPARLRQTADRRPNTRSTCEGGLAQRAQQ